MIRLLNHRIFMCSLVVFLAVLVFTFPVKADPEVTSGNINLGVVGEDEFIAGYVIIPRVPIYWQSDEPWRLTVGSLDSDMGSGDDAAYIKPLENILWRVSDTEDWQPVSVNREEIDWSTDTGSGVVYIDIIVLLDWLTDSPGEYRIDLEFTIDSV